VFWREIPHQKTLCAGACDEQMPIHARSERRRGIVRLRDLAANANAREGIEVRDHGVGRGSTDVVEIRVDAVGAGVTQRRRNVGNHFIIDRVVEAELSAQVINLGGAACDSNDASTTDFGNLAGGRTHGSRGARNDECIARLYGADLHYAEVRREASHAQDAQRGGNRGERGVHFAHARAVGDCILLPAHLEIHDVSGMKCSVARFDHFGDCSAGHHLADFDGGGVAARGAHASTHVRIHGEIAGAYEHFPVANGRERRFHQAEVGFAKHAFGTRGEYKLTIDHEKKLLYYHAMAQTEQNLANHARFDPAFHGFLFFGAIAMLIAAIVHVVMYPNWWGAVAIFGVLWLIVLMFKVRLYALKVQDRVIRLEERLRLQTILSEPLRARVGELNEGQLIALRFASDSEAAGLVEKTLAGKLDRKAIKESVQQWRADNWRV